jgi:hypothetical protein
VFCSSRYVYSLIYLGPFHLNNEQARVRGAAWLEAEAERFLIVCGAPNLGADKKATVIKRTNVYAFVAEAADERSEKKTKAPSGPPPPPPVPLSSVTLGVLLTLFAEALATAGFYRDKDILHGLRFNLDALDRAYAAANTACHAEGAASGTYVTGRLTQPQLEAGWGILTGRGGSTDVRILAPAASQAESKLRADESDTIAKAAVAAKEAAADEKRAAKETAAALREAALVAARGPGWDLLVELLAPHAKALGGLDDVAQGGRVNGALLDALIEAALTSTAQVVVATEKQLRSLPGLNAIRVKKLRMLCAAAEADVEERRRFISPDARGMKVSPAISSKEAKAREKSEREAMQIEDAPAPTTGEVAKQLEDYARSEVMATLFAVVNQIEVASEKQRRAAQVKISNEKRKEIKRLEDEKKATEVAAKVEAGAKKKAAKAAVAAKSAADRKAMLDAKAKASPEAFLPKASSPGPRLAAQRPTTTSSASSTSGTSGSAPPRSNLIPARAASAPRAFTPPEPRSGASTPTSVAGRDRSTPTSSRSGIVAGRFGPLAPVEERSERGSVASDRSNGAAAGPQSHTHRHSMSVDRAGLRPSMARRERFAEAFAQNPARPTSRLFAVAAGASVLGAPGSKLFATMGGGSGASTRDEADLGEVVTAPRSSVSVGRLPRDGDANMASPSRLFAMASGVGSVGRSSTDIVTTKARGRITGRLVNVIGSPI